MKKLSIEKMERIEGGGIFWQLWCMGMLMSEGMPAGLSLEICYYADNYPVTP